LYTLKIDWKHFHESEDQESDSEYILGANIVTYENSPLIEYCSYDFNQQSLGIYDKQACRILGDEYSVDVKGLCFYRFELNGEKIPLMVDDEVDAFNIILRRMKDSKDIALRYLYELVVKGKPIMTFSFIFKHIFEIYKKSQEQKTQRLDLQSTQPQVVDIEKIKNGYTIITPTDTYNFFFVPLSESRNINKVYLIEILSE